MTTDKYEHILEIVSMIVGAIGALILVFFSLRLLINGYTFVGILDLESSAKAGDFVGGVIGTLWAFTSVLLLYITLKLQRRSIQETSKALRKQQFENNYYNLIKTQQEILSVIEVEVHNRGIDGSIISTDKYKGRAFFRKASSDFFWIYKILTQHDDDSIETSERFQRKTVKELYGITTTDIDDVKSLKPEEIIRKSYQLFFQKYDYAIGHYFRHLYHIVKLLKDAETNEIITNPNAKDIYSTYANFIQAQMSSSELFLLFYNCVCFPKMKALIEYYDLLENLPLEDLLDESHQSIYGKEFKSKADIFVFNSTSRSLKTEMAAIKEFGPKNKCDVQKNPADPE